MADNTPRYTNNADIKKYWIDNIAPAYFDFDNYNNYQVGIFGLMMEIMANTVEDSQNAANIIRREFYPVTAQYTSSLNKMAAVQLIDIPMTTPAVAKCGLILDQQEIIDNSTYNNGVYTCVIDNCLKIMADDLQFMVDYPIIILSKKSISGKWTHTIHYDITYSNSLDTKTSARYISNNIIKNDGRNYVVLFIDTIRQVELTAISNLVTKDNNLDGIVMDVDFSGDLANFEVFYYENTNSAPVQLKKVIVNGTVPNVPFCYYDIISDTKIRLSFPANATFTPAFNSEILINVYTSQGDAGNFDAYKDTLICSSDSDRYPYNSNMSIYGLINGSSVGGKAKATTDEFRNQLISQYSTNKTITTSNDLQRYFDDMSNTLENMRVLFRKKRDDALIRLFGAYILLKDANGDVAPTNTLDATILRSDVMSLSDNVNRVMIPAGTLFEYNTPESSSDFTIKKVEGLTILDDLPDDKFYFTTPFLIGANISPNTLGYYLNSVNNTYSIEYSYVNDETENQFIVKYIKLYRSSIMGENYYKISVLITPASSDLDATLMVEKTDTSLPENYIRAEQNGKVVSSNYVFDNGKGYIKAVIRYVDGTEVPIVASNFCYLTDDGETFVYETGYTMQFEPGDSFLKDDILAIKKDRDLGKLRMSLDLGDYLYVNNYYLPLVADSYDSATNGISFVGYVSTDDMIDLNSQIVLTHGIIRDDGTEDDNIAIPMNGLKCEINAFYKNDDINYEHKYSKYKFMTGYTLTNTYSTAVGETFDFIKEISFIRSVLDYDAGPTTENYKLMIDELPVLSANWVKETGNYSYFVTKIQATYEKINLAYYALENNFSIDMKFYNTYGRSRFYRVGLATEILPLNSVNCNFSFGLYLNTVSNTETFITTFRSYVKEYVESIANATTEGQNVYILNMISDIRNNFSEIGYIEYYGFNTYDHMAQKIIAPDITDFQDKYIPEFINIKNTVAKNGTIYPDIQVTLLTS